MFFPILINLTAPLEIPIRAPLGGVEKRGGRKLGFEGKNFVMWYMVEDKIIMLVCGMGQSKMKLSKVRLFKILKKARDTHPYWQGVLEA